MNKEWQEYFKETRNPVKVYCDAPEDASDFEKWENTLIHDPSEFDETDIRMEREHCERSERLRAEGRLGEFADKDSVTPLTELNQYF